MCIRDSYYYYYYYCYYYCYNCADDAVMMCIKKCRLRVTGKLTLGRRYFDVSVENAPVPPPKSAAQSCPFLNERVSVPESRSTDLRA